jgi:DNA-directed RNA polymerase subunit M/transcription elongation factor TFIIS
MIPQRSGDAYVYKCPNCGYEERSGRGSGYKLSGKSSAGNRVKTTSVVSEGRGAGRSQEEIEQEKEEFYEIFLDLLSEEESGGEET